MSVLPNRPHVNLCMNCFNEMDVTTFSVTKFPTADLDIYWIYTCPNCTMRYTILQRIRNGEVVDEVSRQSRPDDME